MGIIHSFDESSNELPIHVWIGSTEKIFDDDTGYLKIYPTFFSSTYISLKQCIDEEENSIEFEKHFKLHVYSMKRFYQFRYLNQVKGHQPVILHDKFKHHHLPLLNEIDGCFQQSDQGPDVVLFPHKKNLITSKLVSSELQGHQLN